MLIREDCVMKKKICLIASSGGHFEQIIMLRELKKDFIVYVVTEDTEYSTTKDSDYVVTQLNRKELFFIYKFIKVFFKSLYIFLKEKPDMIISTGALSVIPTFIIGRIFNKKLVFIESFAKVSSPTITGKLLYKISDVFIVQWEELLDYYPNAIYLGSIY